jgi:opacity protein-like surface antigen
MSLRLDYRYADFGERVLDRTNKTTGAYSTQVKNELSTQAIRAVLSYKF